MMKKRAEVIAIDGPAASGKSAVAERVAAALGGVYVSTGNMYRVVAWAAAEAGMDPKTVKDAGLDRLLATLDVRYVFDETGARLLVNDRAAGAEIRTPEVSAAASSLAKRRVVRDWLTAKQRALAENGRLLVMEGRDIGTVVFPDAAYKFFLTASPEVRALRRLKQGGETPDGATVESVARDIADRDRQDAARDIAPLRQAEDALAIDSSAMTLDEVVHTVIDAVKKKAAADRPPIALEYRVPYADTDKMGFVYYANYLVYFERTRTELLRAAGCPYAEMEAGGMALPVIEAVCRYRRPAKYDDLLTLTGWVEHIEKTRIKIVCEVRRNDELLATGHTEHVCMDIGSGRPVRVPESLIRLFPETVRK